MICHHSKISATSPSQIFPSTSANVALDVTPPDTYVLLCDWRGRIVWKSGTGDHLQIGDELWKRIVKRTRELLRAAVASVVTLRETRALEVECEQGEHFRFWLWPLSEPEVAICAMAKRIPRELSLLTERETACLRLLARGISTRDIADSLGIGLTTVHTHLRRSREKLGLQSGEALIGFAARYFFSPPGATAGSSSSAVCT